MNHQTKTWIIKYSKIQLNQPVIISILNCGDPLLSSTLLPPSPLSHPKWGKRETDEKKKHFISTTLPNVCICLLVLSFFYSSFTFALLPVLNSLSVPLDLYHCSTSTYFSMLSTKLCLCMWGNMCWYVWACVHLCECNDACMQTQESS